MQLVWSWASWASVADPAVGGLGGPPIDQKLGLVMAARSSLPETRGQIFI